MLITNENERSIEYICVKGQLWEINLKQQTALEMKVT